MWKSAWIAFGVLCLAWLLSSKGEARATEATRAEPMQAASVRPSVVRTAAPEQVTASERFAPLLVTKPLPAGRKIAKHSHFRDPLKARTDGLNGRSRRWGDIDPACQAAILERLEAYCKASGLSCNDICYVVAVSRHESGFNPDAAAASSSSCGLTQCINSMRIEYCKRAGVSSQDPFALDASIACAFESAKAAFAFARQHARVGTNEYYAYAYAYHHDGPSLNAGGLKIARSQVLPWMEKSKQCIK